ncbi:MAG: aminopeptidase, partial [Nitrospirota bacterium]|nr:aminopeptidase [Nitrospirota bacterium]
MRMRVSVLVGLLCGGLAVGWLTMIRMPGESHQGPLPPLTEEVRALERELRAHVDMLAGDIGERNLFHYDKLVTAADYIRTMLSRSGYEVHR